MNKTVIEELKKLTKNYNNIYKNKENILYRFKRQKTAIQKFIQKNNTNEICKKFRKCISYIS